MERSYPTGSIASLALLNAGRQGSPKNRHNNEKRHR
jgi:hypothetical protein